MTNTTIVDDNFLARLSALASFVEDLHELNGNQPQETLSMLAMVYIEMIMHYGGSKVTMIEAMTKSYDVVNQMFAEMEEEENT